MADATPPRESDRRSSGGHAPAKGTRPVVSRRREVGDTSARSLLMTLLGEYVLPGDRAVWTSVLVDALAAFDIEEKSARQALARIAGEGWLVSERVGRRVRWALTPPGRRLLTEGAERIYDFGSSARPWDGRWLVVLLSVPETKRDLRRKVQTRLSWAGFGSPESGVWITPHIGHESEVLSILKELGLASEAMSFTAVYGAVGSADTMVSRAWDLRELEEHYEVFIDEFTGLNPVGGGAVLHAQTRLVHEWRRFPFLDPQLPRELLPTNWSGAKAAELFHAKHLEWRPAARQQWHDLCERDSP